jgi:hypothetical protein
MSFDDRYTCEKRNKEKSYERIGLYVHTPADGYENFCDVHVTWNMQDPNPKKMTMPFTGYKAWYSGPMESVSQIKTLERSQLDKDEYARYKNVSPDLDIDAGGHALVVEAYKTGPGSPKLQHFSDFKLKPLVQKEPAYIWLFGPLLLNNDAYGSLYVELTGSFQAGKGFQPLKIHGSSYADGIANFYPAYAGQADYTDFVRQTYEQRVQATHPARLPTNGKWLWKIESFARNKTGCQVIRKKEPGLSSTADEK